MAMLFTMIMHYMLPTMIRYINIVLNPLADECSSARAVLAGPVR